MPNWIGPTTGVELRGFLSGTLTVPSGTPLSFTANSSTDLLTATGHSLTVGNAVYLTIGSAGVLPTGLSEGTRYYVVSVSGDDIGISATAGGSAVNFTTNGSGTLYMLTSTTSYPASNYRTGVTAFRWACTVSSSVVGGVTLYTVTIPSVTIPATTNAVSGYGARWEFHFFRSTGVYLGRWEGYQNLRVPTSAASTTWDAIRIYNNTTVAVADTSTYTKSEIDALLISCCSGGGGGGSSYSRIQEEGSDLTQRTTLNFVGAGFTAADDTTRTTLTLDADLNALAGLSSTGLIARTASNIYALRSISGRADQIDVTNGDGVSGNLSLKIPDYLQLGKDGTGGFLGLQQASSSYVVQFQPSSTVMLGSYVFTLPNALPASTSCIQVSAAGVWSYAASCAGGGGGAPTNATYLTLTTDGTLSDERTIGVGAGLTDSDGGAGGNYLLSVDTSNAFTPTWAGLHTFTVGTNTTSVQGLLIGKASRTTTGQTDSDYISWYGQARQSSLNYRAEWRAMVDVAADSGESFFVLKQRINSGALNEPFRLYQGGDLQIKGSLTTGSGVIQVVNATGNLRVEGFAAASLSGNATKLVTTTGSLTSGNCAEWDADGNLIEASGPCATTAAAAGSTGDYQINSGGSLAAGWLKDLTGGAVSLTDGSGGGGTLRAVPNSPATITSDQNNLTISGRSLNLRLATDAQRTMRGLTFSGTSQVDGELHLIHNVGSYPINFTNEDSSATSTNRFVTASSRTVVLSPNRAALAFYDNTTGRHRLYPLAVEAPEILHRNTATKNVTNTVTETSLLNSTFTVKANNFTVGKTLHIVISGIVSTAVSAPTLQIKLKGGSTVLADSTAITMTSLSGSSRSFTAEITLVCTSLGASGAFDGNGQFRYNTAANGLSALEITNALATLDTTTDLAFDVTATWGTANIQNSISVLSAVATIY